MSAPFAHLHVHSCYSLLRGGNGLHTLLARVSDLGMTAVALTDTNAMYGLVPFYTACRGLDLHPVLGVEITGKAVAPQAQRQGSGPGGYTTNRQDVQSKTGTADSRRSTQTYSGGPPSQLLMEYPRSSAFIRGSSSQSWRLGGSHSQRIVALARNLAGYRNLCRLTTARQLDPDFDLVRACLRYQEGVYFLTAHGPLLTALAAQVPGWRVFAELVPRPGQASREHLRRLRATARTLGIGCVATNDVFFATPDDYATHRTLRAIDHIVAQEQLDPAAHDVAPPDAWLRAADEMAAAFPDCTEAIANAQKIAEDCRVDLPLGTPQFPQAPAAQPPPHNAYLQLRAQCEAGLRRQYGARPGPAVRARLEYELEVIDRLGFSGYFLIVADIVRFARRENIPCVGRGSAADSLVAYVLGIGAVDPIQYDLYFERFLHLGRTDCPDIDIDFCWRGRDTVLDYVYATYGADRVAMICSFITFGARSAFRDVAKTFGLPLDDIVRMSSRLPHADVANIRAALERFPECRDLPFDEEPYRSILTLAERIDGFPRHLGIHPCGIVIAPTPLTDLVPLERATKGLVVTQYDMHPIEALGLVKIDLLGQRALSIVNDAATIVRDVYGQPLDLETLPEPDPVVAEMARTGDTMGCFQIDSPGMRNLLQQMQAETRLDLIKALSLIRPGPAASGMKETYVRRARGLEPTPTLHPILDALLADTHGVLLYQEDLLRIAHKLAGFSRADADALRKAMSKKRSPQRMAAVRERFLRGCGARDVPPAVAQEVWTRMSNFAGYSYCKAHACTYGHISYAGLWLKAYYPTAFYAAVLNNAAGMYSTRTYLEDARRHGIRVLPVDIHQSDYWTTVQRLFHRQDAKTAKRKKLGTSQFGGTPFSTTGAEVKFETPWRLGGSKEPPVALRLGLWHVGGLAKTTIDAMLAARPFADLRDLCYRVVLERDEVDALITCGACDGFGLTRPQLLWEVAQAFAPIQRSRHAEQPLFPGQVFVGHLPPVPDLPEYDAARKLEMEQAVLGLELSMHPLEPFGAQLAAYDLVHAADLRTYAGKRVQVGGWLVASRRVITKKNDYMRFVTLEDPTGFVEVVLFPETYQAYGHLVRGHGPYIVSGLVDDAYGACTLTAEALTVLDAPE